MSTENLSRLRDNILSSLSQDPLLSDLNTDTTLQDLLYKIRVEEEGCIKLRVKKFDGTIIGKFEHIFIVEGYFIKFDQPKSLDYEYIQGYKKIYKLIKTLKVEISVFF